MAPDHDPSTPPTIGTETVAARVERYRSNIVPPQLWARYAGDLKALVLASQPSSAEDAKSILGTASRFILDATVGGRDLDFDDVFSEVEVAAYCSRFQQRSGNTKTYDNHRGRLNRLLRAKYGVPQQHRTSRAVGSEPPPYTESELRAVVDAALVRNDRGAAQVVVLGAGAGSVDDAAHRVLSMPTVSSPANRLGLCPGERVHVDAEAWTRARRYAKQAGIDLNQRRLEITWAASLVASPVGPVGAVIREHRLSRRLLENTNRALGAPTDEEVVKALSAL